METGEGNQTPVGVDAIVFSEKEKQSTFTRRLHRILSIRILTIIFVVVVVLTACILSWVMQTSLTRRGVDSLAISIRELIRIDVSDQVGSILTTAKTVARVDNGTYSYNIQTTNSSRLNYSRHIFRMMQAMPSVGTISYASLQGDVVGARRVFNYTLSFETPTEGVEYFWVARSDPTRTLYSYQINLPGIGLGPLVSAVPDYDIQSRPWVRSGYLAENQSYIWTHNFYTSLDVPVVSLTQPFFDDDNSSILVGFLGVILYIPTIKAIMNDVVGVSGSSATQAILVDQEGTFVADSCAFDIQRLRMMATCGEIARTNDQPQTLASSEGIYKSIDTHIRQQLGGYDSVPHGYSFDSGGYWVGISRFRDNNLNWLIIIVTPSRSFLDVVSKSDNITLYCSIAFGVAAAILAGITSMFISGPVTSTTIMMDKLSVMRFERMNSIQKSSRIAEIRQMQKSCSRLHKALVSFAKFVPPIVVNEMVSKNVEVKLGVQEHEVSIFFCDIEDFTTIAEIARPDILTDLLQDFPYGLASIITDRAQGTLDKFIGDAIMAFWNAPYSVHEHEKLACQAAVLCRREVHDVLQPRWTQLGLPMMKLRIGIHTGEVLVGNIGSPSRINYTAIGDNVNIAARLESLCKFYDVCIIISGKVYEKVKDSFLCRPLDNVIVKGKTQSLMLYELVENLEQATPEQIAMCSRHEEAHTLKMSTIDTDRMRDLDLLRLSK
eukprot:TRINITY_DN5509_c0_g1_i5.p1 TRINITY_DN5509_c0_g1~~TRINITY_DN5509_c0_g1_i5.p1  ORF type:complete len:739 (+),score=89.88 TRINITY_DN5509_c0_g1_i5:61-2217(+)